LSVLSNNIRTFRKQNGFSQAQLADKIGVSQTAVFYWEKGTREPDVKTIMRISELLHVSLNDLYGVEEDTTAHDFQETCDWLELAGFSVEQLDEYDNFRILDADEKEVGSMNEYDLINLCQQIIEQGQELKDSFIVEKLRLLFSK